MKNIAGLIVDKNTGKVLVINNNGDWGIPAVSGEKFETSYDTALREFWAQYNVILNNYVYVGKFKKDKLHLFYTILEEIPEIKGNLGNSVGSYDWRPVGNYLPPKMLEAYRKKIKEHESEK